MYNTKRFAPRQIAEQLLTRTLAYHNQTQITDPASLSAFRHQWEPRPQDKLLDGLPSCPFLGYLNVREPVDLDDGLDLGPVGCLVHPLQNDGVDGRDCGVYDRHICEDYLCAAHSLLNRNEKWLVLNAVQDSFLYGLVMTDVRFIRALFEQAAHINGMMPPTRCVEREEAVDAARGYFELKRQWPYRDHQGIFGAVLPEQGLDTTRRKTPVEQLANKVDSDPLDVILTCLGTHVETPQDLLHARSLVRTHVIAFAAAVDLASSHP